MLCAGQALRSDRPGRRGSRTAEMTDFAERFELLRRRFVERAGEDADAIESAARATDWTVVRDIAHSLSGRAGMFGFPALSDAARMIETAVDRGDPTQAPRAASFALVSDLRKLA
ncbi:MAG: Hpt domain-containing protein [Sphingomonadales bacterium]|nr:MAG: Hpt domain-containing protein [Sphingomonadales bacterium]